GDPPAGRASGCNFFRNGRPRRRRRDFAIERHGGLQRDKRNPVADEPGEAFVQALGLGFEQTHIDLDSSCSQFGKTLSGNLRIWILHGADHPFDASRNYGIGTGPGSSLVRTWFQVEIERSAAGAWAGLFERERLSVLDAIVGVRAGAS